MIMVIDLIINVYDLDVHLTLVKIINEAGMATMPIRLISML